MPPVSFPLPRGSRGRSCHTHQPDIGSAPTLVAAALLALVIGCGPAALEPGSEGAFTDHDEPSDFVPVDESAGKADLVPRTFDRTKVLTEALFDHATGLTAEAVQKFLENTPYETRCFLADYSIHDTTAAQAIVNAARGAGINPIVLLARMQAESSLISRTTRPSDASLDFAFGCGCPDNRSCMEAYRGIDRQLACAADTLKKLHDASVDGTGEWRIGKSHRTLDGFSIIPQNDATAAHYAYTPWVLVGQGGNWLVWNVLRKYLVHFEELGYDELGGALPTSPWIGTACQDDSHCVFVANGERGYCFRYQLPDSSFGGFCSLPCLGYCPDRSESAPTFCVANGDAGGMCAAKADPLNNQCTDVPGTYPVATERYLGTASVSPANATVCLPWAWVNSG